MQTGNMTQSSIKSFSIAIVWVAAWALVLLPFSCVPARAADAPKIKSCVAIRATEPTLPEGIQRAWGQPSKFWPQKATVRVRFLTGTSRQKAEAWKRFAVVDALVNLTFVQVPSGASEVRVRFDSGKGHWSYLGTDSRTVGQSAQTMNLELKAGLFGDLADEWDRVAIHEVCHAVGLEHEHQSPLATKLVWNRDAVYAYYGQTQGWSRAQIDFQVLNRSTAKNYVTTGWDANSILEYPVPAGLANVVIGWNRALTGNDIALLRRIYP